MCTKLKATGQKTASVKVTAHEKTLKENLKTERKK
jgi:hypothetical protein